MNEYFIIPGDKLNGQLAMINGVKHETDAITLRYKGHRCDFKRCTELSAPCIRLHPFCLPVA